MKKKCLILIVGAALLIVGLLGLALMRANDLVRILQPQIEAQIAKVIGAPVTIGRIELSLLPSIELVVQELTLGEEQGAPRLGALRARLALLSLLQRELKASEITLQRPQLTLLKGRDGISIRGLPRRPAATAPAAEQPASSRQEPKQSPGAQEPSGASGAQRGASSLQLQLERIVVSDGSLVLTDLEKNTSMPLSGIELSAGVQLQGALVTIPSAELHVSLPQQNHLKIQTRASTFNRDTGELSVPDTEITTNAGKVQIMATLIATTQHGTITIASEKLSMSALQRLVTPFIALPVPLALDGGVAINRAEIKLAGPGAITFQIPLQFRDGSLTQGKALALRSLDGDLALEGSASAMRLTSRKLALNLNQAPLSIALNGEIRLGALTVIALRRLDLEGFGGRGSLPFTFEVGTPNRIRTNVNLKELSIERLLSAFAAQHAGKLSGTLVALQADVRGDLTPGAPILRGPGSLTITKASLKGINLPRSVLASIEKGLPFVQGSLAQQIPAEFQSIMNEPDTRIESLKGTFELQGDLTLLRSLSIISPIFSIESSGSIARDGELNLTTTLTFSEPFSKALARRVKDLGKIYDTQGRLVVPFTLQGKVPKLVILPDLSKLMQTGAGRIIEREAERAIDKVLKKDPNTAKQVKGLLGGLLKR